LLFVLSIAGVVIRTATATSDRRPAGDVLAGDPAGAEACGVLDGWLRGGRTEHEFEIAKRAAVPARRSSTEAISSSANGIADSRNSDGTCCTGVAFADLRRLHRACAGAGVDLPRF
jgi:hypothetical protein